MFSCMGRRMIRKLCLVVLVAMCCALGTVYVAFFHHAPAAEILAANKAYEQGRMARRALQAESQAFNSSEAAEDFRIAEYQSAKWDTWVESHNYVSIGETYDKCEGPSRIMLGRLVMLPDKKKGGLLARLFVNATLADDVTEGGIHIDIKYNGRQLYKNRWDLCTAEEREVEVQDKVLSCPLRTGRIRIVKSFKIPSFLPKGHFQTSIDIVNQDELTFLCTHIDFTL